jgi:hypothetical protein
LGALEAELWRLCRRVELRFHRLAAEADEAYRDLRTAVRVVGGDRVVLTFRRSSLHFAAGAVLWSLAFVLSVRVLLGLALRAWGQRGWGRGWWGGAGGGGAVVRRRDRSLGGKEVVVAVSSPVAAAPSSRVPEPARLFRRMDPQAKVPEWWPEVGMGVTEPGPEIEKWARLANRLVRGECLYSIQFFCICHCFDFYLTRVIYIYCWEYISRASIFVICVCLSWSI